MKDLVQYIISNIVSKPEAVKIDETSSEGDVNLLLTVDSSDMGLVIGKGGQMIKAVRRLLTVRAMSENVRVNLQINEPSSEENIKEIKD